MAAEPAYLPAGRRRRGPIDDQSGVVAIEFALTLPLILLVLFAIIEFGQVFNNLNTVNHIAANGARMAAVNAPPPGGGSLQDYLEDQPHLQYLKDSIDVCIDFPGTSNVGQPVKVVAEAPYTLPALLFGATLNLHGEATMRIERVPSYAEDC